MKKRTLLMVVSLVLTLALTLGSTLAYLTDTDEAVNVMTLGNVDIEQIEEGFTQSQPLYPAYKNDDEIVGELEKKVSVKNVGPSDAFVRTWFAFEAGTMTKDDFNNYIHAEFSNDVKVEWPYETSVDIDGQNYFVACVVYLDAVEPGKETAKSLLSVWMDGEADNKIVNMFGGTYEILVLSQAVQTVNLEQIGAEAALNAAFGKEHPWVDADIPTLPTVIVKTAAELKDALEKGGTTVILANDIELNADETITIAAGKTARLDLAGHTLSGVAGNTGNREMILVKGNLTVNDGTMEMSTTNNQGWSAMTTIFDVTAGGVLNLNGVTAKNLGGTDMAFVAHLNNWGEVTLNVNNSTLQSTYIAVRVFNSGNGMNNVTIENSTLIGKYSLWVQYYTEDDFGGNAEKTAEHRALLNFDIEGNGNTFVGPVLYGFTDSITDDEIKTNGVMVNSNAAFTEKINAGETTLYLTDGNYVIPTSAQGKTLTIIGNGNSIIATQIGGTYEGCDYALDGSNVTFENIVINTTSKTYTGYARCNATYNNCTINGTYTLYGNSEFNNCTFNVSGDVYNIWTWGAPTATFNGCTFNSDGKALLLYGQANTKLTVNECVFNDKGGLTDLKAAIEIANDYNKSYELIVKKTTVNGYEINDKGIITGTTLWGNKSSMDKDHLNVVVDGVDVY